MALTVERYTTQYKCLWDNFVLLSRNGTFLFYRDYMEYHADCFSDSSLLFFEKDKPIALLPGNISENTFYSHQGLTYGGLILSCDTKTSQTIEILNMAIEYLQKNGVTEIIYKAIPHIYHRYPSQDDLYALSLNNAVLLHRSISSAIDLSNKLDYAVLRKRQIKKASKHHVTVCESNLLGEFWAVLQQNLRDNHQAVATHSLDEIEYLKSKFPHNIRLFCVVKDNQLLAGCLIFETHTVAHAQYISASGQGKEVGALDVLFDHLINNIFAKKKYFDFGISTENHGQFLNRGLISQKEGFGGRGIVYDTYKIALRSYGLLESPSQPCQGEKKLALGRRGLG